MNTPNELRGEPVGELLKRLSEQTSELIRQELALARAEMTAKGKRLGLGAGLFGGAGIFVLLALGTLSACLVAAIAVALPVWAAALIVTAMWLVVAAVMALIGRQEIQRATPPVPEQTVETLKEDVEWAKTQMRSAGR
jgi:uncharacterized membrane protein YqjE